jgi:hypothetical protein
MCRISGTSFSIAINDFTLDATSGYMGAGYATAVSHTHTMIATTGVVQVSYTVRHAAIRNDQVMHFPLTESHNAGGSWLKAGLRL